MPQASSVVINDGATTPVAHTFTPTGKDSKGVIWFEQTTPAPANPLVAKRIGKRQIRGAAGTSLRSVGKLTLTVSVPTGETLAANSSGITPPPQLAYMTSSRVEFDLPERGLKQERKDTRVLTANLLNHAGVVTNVDDLQADW